MLRRIAAWAARRGLQATLTGVDLNPKSESVARALTPPDMAISYRTGDYREMGPFDFAISSLVAHHMTDPELRRFVQFM
jgi:2-polyprenyl-3-methyl-5-hydroxy-6-metoxy-1,4-benzoquinol methylase